MLRVQEPHPDLAAAQANGAAVITKKVAARANRPGFSNPVIDNRFDRGINRAPRFQWLISSAFPDPRAGP